MQNLNLIMIDPIVLAFHPFHRNLPADLAEKVGKAFESFNSLEVQNVVNIRDKTIPMDLVIKVKGIAKMLLLHVE